MNSDKLINSWHTVYGFLYSQKVVVALMITSAVKTFPLPGQPFRLYTFLYDWSHQFFNITNTRLSPTPVITPPEANPEPPDVSTPSTSGA